ncbi:MAG: aminopeptidase [Oscillospiraceae bacterium]|nr:aminopeptidase [Oscillospiraceae bacterium]
MADSSNETKQGKQENKQIKDLKEKLFFQRKNICTKMTDSQIKQADKFCDGYKYFLDNGKTEREACELAVKIAKSAGFSEFVTGKKYKSGDKVYRVNRGKAVVFAVVGSEPVSGGVNIIASHIDAPRIDLKQNPLFEDGDLAYFKTHYYGGIKKYQWTAVPLALHGVIVKADGGTVTVNVGEDDGDPVFTVTDLLPHLSEAQYKRPANELIRGEELNLLIGSRPFKSGKDSDSVKLGIMKILHDKYGITEGDFMSAELEVVPAAKSRDIGFDRSIVGGYGQDDRVCAYTSLMAILEAAKSKTAPKRTAVCVLADKEEVGSVGSTGLDSMFLQYFINDVVQGVSAKSDYADLTQVLTNSKCISADVCAAYDPTFPDVYEKNNAPFMNGGAVITKYVGSRGKSGTNDASAEYLGEIRSIFDKAKVLWQTGELGKVDAGGGGTVAMFVAGMNVDTVDIGVPILSMHSPMELVSKADVFMAFKGFAAFYGN